MLAYELYEARIKPQHIPSMLLTIVTAQKKTPTEFFAPGMRTRDYKYFGRSCRALWK
jgi:hypothetical protein